MVFYFAMAVDRNSVVKEAQKFASKGQFDKAIAEWRKLAKEAPDDANIFNTIGDLCLKKNAKTDAVEAYKRAADLLAADGFTSKAIALYKKVLNIDNNQVQVHLALGDMNAEKGLTGNALENYKHVADHYNKLNKKAEALGIYQKMADLNPANVAFRVKLAGMYAKEGMQTEAVQAYLAAADQHIAKDELQDARKMFEKVLELDKTNKAVYHKAGVVYYKEGKLDEARKSLKRAFEADPGNEELMNLYLEVLEKADRAGDAEEVYRKQLEQDPSRQDLQEKILRLLIEKKDYDRALTEAAAIAEQKAESMDFSGAAEVLKGLIAVTHDPPAAAAALADLFGKHGRARDGAKELVQAAEALIERGGMDDAREVLNRALVLAPDLAEAKEKLEGLAGSAAAAEPADLGGGEAVLGDLSLPEIEVPLPVGAPAATPPPPPAPAAEQEDPAVAGALAEVEVLIKYGLGPKAVEQLEGIVQRFPDVPRVRAMLLDLYREQKKSDKAVIQALMLAELHERRGRQNESQEVLRSALELAPGNRQIMAKLGMAEEEEAEAPEAIEMIEEPEAIEDLDEVPELSVPEIELDAPAALEDFETEAEEPPAKAAAPRRYVPPAEEEPEEELEPAPPVRRTPAVSEAEIEEIRAEAEFYFQQGLFDEARRSYERLLELRPGDRTAMERIVEITREAEDVNEFSRLTEAVEGLERLVESGPTAEDKVTRSDVDSVRSLMREISDQRKGAPPAPEEAEESFADVAAELGHGGPADREESFAGIADDLDGGPPAARSAPTAQERDEADFFDLAAELKDELGASSPTAPASLHEQSIDEIFEEFKKGVEEHEKKEDEDTHYNLGVAYREMGLLDDAVSEFNMTNEGEPKFIQSRYMLGLCYLEKGDYETAITEIQNALGYSYSFGEASEERVGMHYDLGLAYQGTGNTQSALEELQKVYNLDPAYQDVATKLRELQQGDFVSLESIKEDIEKEISFKFLEEGARIEREEKTKPKKAKK